MKKWYWTLTGLLVLDGLLILLAFPLMAAVDGNTETAMWGALALRVYGAGAAVVLVIALIVVWNIDYNLPKK